MKQLKKSTSKMNKISNKSGNRKKKAKRERELSVSELSNVVSKKKKTLKEIKQNIAAKKRKRECEIESSRKS